VPRQSKRWSNVDDEHAVVHNKLIPIDADTVIMTVIDRQVDEATASDQTSPITNPGLGTRNTTG